MEFDPTKRVTYSLIFAVVVLLIMIGVDFFMFGFDKMLSEETPKAVFYGKKFMDLVVGFLIGYFILFKKKKTDNY